MEVFSRTKHLSARQRYNPPNRPKVFSGIGQESYNRIFGEKENKFNFGFDEIVRGVKWLLSLLK